MGCWRLTFSGSSFVRENKADCWGSGRKRSRVPSRAFCCTDWAQFGFSFPPLPLYHVVRLGQKGLFAPVLATPTRLPSRRPHQSQPPVDPSQPVTMASVLPTLEPTHDAEGDFADDDDGDFEDAIGEPEDSSPPLVGPPPSPPHPTPPRSAPPSAIATPDPSSRVTASGTSGSPPTASIHEAGEPLVVASPAQDNEPVRDPQDEEVTQLHIEHSDDEEQEVEVESEAEEEESRTPTATSPTRTSMTPQEPPSIPSGAFDYSRTSEWETSLPPTPSSASTSYLSAEKTAPQPSPKPPAARSNRFSISSLSAPPDTPTAFTSVSEHFSASPSTDVSDGTSPSISSAVWRNSAMGNGKALVEVSLGDDDGRDSSGDEVSLDGKGAVGSASLHGSEASGSGSAKANGKRSADASDVQEEKKDEVNFLLQRLESQ